MKIIILFCCLAIASFTVTAQPGTLDKTFSEDGKAFYLPVIRDLVSDAIVLNNGDILQLGSYNMIAVLPNGGVDSSFGKNGIVVYTPEAPDIFVGAGLVQQADGKILVGGAIQYGVALFRYNEDGTVDKSFGENGRVITDAVGYYSFIFGLALQPDGKIVTTGFYRPYFEGPESPLLMRFNADGSLDKEFGDGGKIISEDISGYCRQLALQPDGKIVTGGYRWSGDYSFMVMRYTAEGGLDSSFGTNGITVTYIDARYDVLDDIALQADGKIVGVGLDGQAVPVLKNFIGVIRLNTDGTLDESFGKGGKLTIKPVNCRGKSVVIQKNGKIVLGALGGSKESKDGDFMIVRLLENGNYDESFGDSGIAVTDIYYADEVNTVLLDKAGKIVAAGTSINYKTNNDDSLYKFILARYLGDPVNLITKATIKRWIKNHILNWQATVSNNDISYYAIERSQSGTAGFTQIAKVKANKVQPNAATATYAYNLASNAAANSTATNYYRIRAVNTDGSFVYSDVVSDAGLQTGSAFTISPNPARDVIKVSGLPANRKTVVNIVNRNGNVLQTVTAQSSAISINVNALHSGVYYVQLFVAEKTEWLTFIKE